jgi:7-carboxy-7-deazaguanine synthase
MSDILVITEIYRSIQGESTYAGLPCTFVRLTGCDLRCTWCDTEYAFHGGTKMSVNEVYDRALSFNTDIVEVTGGEPLLQPKVHLLMKRLADAGKKVLIETSGAHDISKCDPRVIRIMDLKCPASGEMDRNRYENISHLTSRDEVKFVITDRKDFEWSIQMAREFRLADRCTILFSAAWKQLPLQQLGEWIAESDVRVRLQPQLHKILWGDRPSV